jgi:hypothetical protein
MQNKSWLKFIHLSLMFIVLCCASQLCLAQLDRGSISGVVTDPSGSSIAGASITVTNTAMGTQNSTVTTAREPIRSRSWPRASTALRSLHRASAR